MNTLHEYSQESEAVPFSRDLLHRLNGSVIRLWLMSARYHAKNLEKEI
jgi:hypothetical protein